VPPLPKPGVVPEMAACETALESAYGRSMLAVQDKNLLG
jgi:flagellum-specific peptidoglycan hydrolase FlgJ